MVNTINIFKEAIKKNRILIISVSLFVTATEIFTGIMRYNLHYDEIGAADFWGNIFFRIFALVAGTILAYFFCGLLNNELSGIFAVITTVLTVVTSTLEKGYGYDKCYNICVVLALLSLSFYYMNSCISSFKHTVCYYIIVTVLAAATVDKIEFFIVLVVVLLMVASSKTLIKVKSVLIVNGICAVVAIAAMTCAVVDRMDAYLGIVYIEGYVIHPERVLLSSQIFGSSEYFGEIADAPSMYNLAKIFGYFGSIPGAVMSVMIAMFVASVGVKCFGGSSQTKSERLVAATIISIRCFAGFFENFSIISGLYSGIPVLSEGSCGYFVLGILLGAILAPCENVESMKGIFKSLLGREAENDYNESEEYDYV